MQKLLFADPRPLVERLGLEFFRTLPESPGVYLMRDIGDAVLYVGKARNLRKRLGSYRVANPERLPRRRLRLLHAVARIEIRESADERAALAQEAELLRVLRPRFNRTGTWTPPPKFLICKVTSGEVRLALVPEPERDGLWHGPHRAGAKRLRDALARLLWFARCPADGITQLPLGRLRGGSPDGVAILFEAATLMQVVAQLEALFQNRPDGFAEWIRGKMPASISLFEKAMMEADAQFVTGRFAACPASPPPG